MLFEEAFRSAPNHPLRLVALTAGAVILSFFCCGQLYWCFIEVSPLEKNLSLNLSLGLLTQFRRPGSKTPRPPKFYKRFLKREFDKRPLVACEDTR